MRKRRLPLLLLLPILVFVTDRAAPQSPKSTRTVERGVIATVTGTASAPPQPALPPDVQRRYDSFLKVWSTLRDNYFDKTFNHLDWSSVRSEFEPRVKAAKTDGELYRLLDEMLGRLNRSHLVVIPPEVYETLNEARKASRRKEREVLTGKRETPQLTDNSKEEDFLGSIDETAPYGIGVELSLINDRFVITRMEPNSAAEYVGLKRGYIIEKVNGVSLQDMLTRVMIYHSSNHSTNVKQFVPAYVVSSMLNGTPDTYVSVGYLDENDQPREIKIRREPLKEQIITISPNFPPSELSFQSSSLDEKTGFIRFNMFALPVIDKFCRAIGDFKDKQGLIIDLRGNTGGVLATIPVLAGMLTSTSIDLGTSIYRYRSETLKAPSKAKNYKGRVVVLVDDRTASAAEMFALSLRENGRALLVGQHTSGEALPSVAVKLSTGAMLLYPFANYRSVGGTYIEGTGIEPDRPAAIDRKDLLAGKDLQLDTARSLLSDDASFASLKAKKEDPPSPPDYAGPVPPPAPIKKAPPVNAGGASKISSPPAPKALTGQDAASKKYIDAFLKSIGGAEALRSLVTVSIKGRATLSTYGSTSEFSFQAYRQGDEKFSELLYSDATGEIREVINGKEHFVQSAFGGLQDLSSTSVSVSNSDAFSMLTDLGSAYDLYPALQFKGVFDREGRKTALVEGRTKTNGELALAFDAETGLLVNVTEGYSSVSFGDYRKVGDLLLPFSIDMSGFIKVKLEEVNLNPTIDPSFFARKVSCFDKVD